MTKTAQPTRLHPQRPGSSAGFRLIAERREPPGLERFVAALLSFTMAKMDKEEAEREAKRQQATPPKPLKTTEYEVLVQPEDGRYFAYPTALDGCLGIGETKEEALQNVVPRIIEFHKTMKRIGYKPRKARLDGRLTPEATRHVVNVPKANQADLAVH